MNSLITGFRLLRFIGKSTGFSEYEENLLRYLKYDYGGLINFPFFRNKFYVGFSHCFTSQIISLLRFVHKWCHVAEDSNNNFKYSLGMA